MSGFVKQLLSIPKRVTNPRVYISSKFGIVESRFYSIQDLHKIILVPERTIRQWCADGKVPGVVKDINGQWIIKGEILLNFAEKLYRNFFGN